MTMTKIFTSKYLEHIQQNIYCLPRKNYETFFKCRKLNIHDTLSECKQCSKVCSWWQWIPDL